MLRHWRKLLSIFTRHERLQIYALLASTTFLGLIEVAGIASIMPFIAVIVDASIIDRNPYLHALYQSLGFADHRRFQLFLGAVSFVLLIVSNVFTAFDAWFTFRFCYLRSHLLCTRLLSKYLAQPYHVFLQRSSAELQKIILTEVDRVVIGTLMAGIGLFSDVVSAIFILAVLFLIDPWVTLSTLAGLTLSYALIFLFVQRRVSLLGEEMVGLGTEIVQRTREALEAVKEIKVLDRGADFVRRFSGPRYRSAVNSIRHKTLDIVPHQALESVAFGIIILVTLYFLVRTNASSEALAVIALYAFAAYRLIPTLKEIVDSVDTIRYNAAALEVVCSDFTPDLPQQAGIGAARAVPIVLTHELALEGVTFTYPGARTPAVESLDMKIEAGSLTCLMGPTGAGKSTVIDLVLGLLEPDCGRILIDGVPLTDARVRSWQAAIGYVPQSIYLTDDTIARNIALGLPDEAIDRERLHTAARCADIHDFIVNELSEGYDTIVGERGLRLSGGQRQRIGIARALYLQPQVLVLDEATNALDLETEGRVLTRLLELQPRRTIIFVSHRASVARRADRILVLTRGRLAARGSYDELSARDSEFRGLLAEET